MPARALSDALLSRAATVAKAEGVQITLEAGKVRVTIDPNGKAVLPSQETGGASCDDILRRMGSG